MGQFSWIYSDTKKQVVDDMVADTYLLVPGPFQEKYGEYIFESCCDGYGNFGKYDVYNLIVEWNKNMIPEIIQRIENGSWQCKTSKEDVENLLRYHNGLKISCELRWLGIIIACYDKDNFALEYPIKITSKPMKYEDAKPSKRDPKQGWKY